MSGAFFWDPSDSIVCLVFSSFCPASVWFRLFDCCAVVAFPDSSVFCWSSGCFKFACRFLSVAFVMLVRVPFGGYGVYCRGYIYLR